MPQIRASRRFGHFEFNAAVLLSTLSCGVVGYWLTSAIAFGSQAIGRYAALNKRRPNRRGARLAEFYVALGGAQAVGVPFDPHDAFAALVGLRNLIQDGAAYRQESCAADSELDALGLNGFGKCSFASWALSRFQRRRLCR